PFARGRADAVYVQSDDSHREQSASSSMRSRVAAGRNVGAAAMAGRSAAKDRSSTAVLPALTLGSGQRGSTAEDDRDPPSSLSGAAARFPREDREAHRESRGLP